MKTKLFITSIVVSLMSLIGCSDDNNKDIAAYNPWFCIEYVDAEGNNLISKIYEKDGEWSPVESMVEILSVTNQTSRPVEYESRANPRSKRPAFPFDIKELIVFGAPEAERIYTVRYKAPKLIGTDRVEELKLIFNIPKHGEGEFCKVWYNGDEIDHIIHMSDFYSDIKDEKGREGIVEKINKAIYTGKRTVTVGGSSSSIILPVE